MGSSIQRFGIAIKLTLTLFNFISSGVKSVRFSITYFNPKLFQIVGSMLDTKWTEEVDNGISLNILIFGSVIECCLLSLILIISTCANNDTETLLCACEKIPLLLIIGLIEGPLLYWLGLSSYYTIGAGLSTTVNLTVKRSKHTMKKHCVQKCITHGGSRHIFVFCLPLQD